MEVHIEDSKFVIITEPKAIRFNFILKIDNSMNLILL